MATKLQSVDDTPDKSGGDQTKDEENTHRQRVTFEITDNNFHDTQ